MSGTRNQRKPKNPRYAGPEPRIGRLECRPAPDAEDRLRRLFTPLASHLASGDMTGPEQDAADQVPPAKDHAEAQFLGELGGPDYGGQG